jgi:hypothetical protein
MGGGRCLRGVGEDKQEDEEENEDVEGTAGRV